MKIKTECVCPPIPLRHFDWMAYDDDTYDGSDYCLTGHGATEQEAISDLMEQMEDRQLEADDAREEGETIAASRYCDPAENVRFA